MYEAVNSSRNLSSYSNVGASYENGSVSHIDWWVGVIDVGVLVPMNAISDSRGRDICIGLELLIWQIYDRDTHLAKHATLYIYIRKR